MTPEQIEAMAIFVNATLKTFTNEQRKCFVGEIDWICEDCGGWNTNTHDKNECSCNYGDKTI